FCIASNAGSPFQGMAMNKRAFSINASDFSVARFTARLTGCHGLVLVALFLGSLCVASAQDAVQASPSAVETLVGWVPFILKGFLLNLYMSAIAMAMATILGIGLGLMQISLFRPLRAIAWLITHLFRNSPWLVILFAVMFMLPSDIPLPGGISVPFSGWMKATVAFALPVMGNISEIVRGAIISIPTGQ